MFTVPRYTKLIIFHSMLAVEFYCNSSVTRICRYLLYLPTRFSLFSFFSILGVCAEAPEQMEIANTSELYRVPRSVCEACARGASRLKDRERLRLASRINDGNHHIHRICRHGARSWAARRIWRSRMLIPRIGRLGCVCTRPVERTSVILRSCSTASPWIIP